VGFRRGGRVALTFDDGPSEWTEAIVDQIEIHKARATFFVLGCAIKGREASLRRIAAAGCEVGIHGYTHRRLMDLPDDDIRSEMSRTAALIKTATGQTPTLWRAPYLDADDRVRALCADLGLREVWMTADTKDYMSEPDQVVARAVGGLRSGAVILMHDGRSPLDPPDSLLSRAGTVKAVPAILREAKRRGLASVTVSEIITRRRRRRVSDGIGFPTVSFAAGLRRWASKRLGSVGGAVQENDQTI
jgi:peptidoglycan/xylan/chitin deacetylase (PgdA/CDA1 family)